MGSSDNPQVPGEVGDPADEAGRVLRHHPARHGQLVGQQQAPRGIHECEVELLPAQRLDGGRVPEDQCNVLGSSLSSSLSSAGGGSGGRGVRGWGVWGQGVGEGEGFKGAGDISATLPCTALPHGASP